MGLITPRQLVANLTDAAATLDARAHEHQAALTTLQEKETALQSAREAYKTAKRAYESSIPGFPEFSP